MPLRASGAGVAQDFYTVKVAGSNPASPIIVDNETGFFHLHFAVTAGIIGPFISKFAALAQLVEHSTEN